MRTLSIVLLLMIGFEAYSQKLKIPESELSTESVLPKFEENIAIRNRTVDYKGAFELSLVGGMVPSEPIYSPYILGGSVAYHFNNTHGVHGLGLLHFDGLTSGGQDLRNGNVISTSGGTPTRFNALLAPHKEFMLALHYQYTAYYGKVSLSKQSVLNLSLAGLFGTGAYMMGGDPYPMVNVGVAQRFYLTNEFFFRLDILFSFYNGPDITSSFDTTPLSTNMKPSNSDFDDIFSIDTIALVGVGLLF